jgi:hypothetical protein
VFVVLLDCEDGDEADRLASLSGSPRMASRRVGRTKVQVEVLDGDRALAELQALESAQALSGSLDGAVDAVVRRGWHIERDETREDDYEFSWQIGARAPGEHLRLFVRWSSASPQPPRLDEDGQAKAVFGVASVSVAIRSAHHAQALLDVLLPRG